MLVVGSVHAKKSEQLFGLVQAKAHDIGMRVNEKKTQMLCMHACKNNLISSYIRVGNGSIQSTNELKILGFKFNQDPTAIHHVNSLIDKFYSRLWTLRFLKKGGMSKPDLVKIYESVIRPAVEYSGVVYHSLIPQYQSDKLESIQKQAFRIIYGLSLIHI